MTEQTNTPTEAQRKEFAAMIVAIAAATKEAKESLKHLSLPTLFSTYKRYVHELEANVEVPYDPTEMMFTAEFELSERRVETVEDAGAMVGWINFAQVETGLTDKSGEGLGKVTEFLKKQAATQAPQAAA